MAFLFCPPLLTGCHITLPPQNRALSVFFCENICCISFIIIVKLLLLLLGQGECMEISHIYILGQPCSGITCSSGIGVNMYKY